MAKCKECGFDKQRALRESYKLKEHLLKKFETMLSYELDELLKQEDYLSNEMG